MLFMTDSMDGRVMSHLGHPAAHTPNMDRLAARGTSFRNAYCNSPQCGPSRASFWSGQYAHRVDAWNNPRGLRSGARTFATQLTNTSDGFASGYGTRASIPDCVDDYGVHVFGKTDYEFGGHSLKARVAAWMRSADIKRPHNPRPEAVTVDPDTVRMHVGDWTQVDAAVAFLRDRSEDDSPFLIYPSTNVPHPPFRTTATYLDLIDIKKVSLPPYEASLHPVMDYMSVTKNTHDAFSEEEILAIRQHYFAMVAETDAMLGEVLDTLETTGQLDNTYVIFSSDHGEMNMEHRQTLKNALYEASVRVPLIVSGPGIRHGVISDELVSLIDLYPTLLDMAEKSVPNDVDGVSLLPICRGEVSRSSSYVFAEYHSNFANTGIAMGREGPWKYVRYAGYRPQLFNVEDDPDELVNLADVLPAQVQLMDARLERLVDFDEIDRRAKAADRQDFVEWRSGLTADEYRTAMTDVHRGVWDADDDACIEGWLDAG